MDIHAPILSFNGSNPAEQFARKNRGIVPQQPVASRDQVWLAQAGGGPNDPMDNQYVLSRVHHDVSQGNFLWINGLDGKYIAGMDSGHHAGAHGGQSNASAHTN
jgi:hypothetical protein